VTGNSIIVGVDGSAAAQSALRWAADEACIRQRTLLVVHAPDFAESRLIASAGEPAIRALDDLGERLLSQHAVAASTRQPGVLVTTLFSHSRAVDVLIDLSLDAGLLVVGTHGRGFESMLGSVSHRVAARAHCPVAVVPDARALWGRYQSPRIVVGVSSAPAGRLALEFAFGEAQHRNATVVAVRAWNRIDAAITCRRCWAEPACGTQTRRSGAPSRSATAKCATPPSCPFSTAHRTTRTPAGEHTRPRAQRGRRSRSCSASAAGSTRPKTSARVTSAARP